jgi:hypothetical protein
MLQEWKLVILSQEQEQECARQIVTKEEKDPKTWSKEEKEQQDTSKQMLENNRGKEDMEQNLSPKEELGDQKASISDMSMDDEATWVHDGVDLHGHSQVESD